MTSYAPVAVHVRAAEGEAVVYERGVDGHALLGAVEQVAEVVQVAVAAAHAVARAVLIQHEQLPVAQPALSARSTHTVGDAL